MDEVIIDVRLNEYTSREHNRHVPFTPEEIAVEAASAVDAGASIAHFHARAPDGAASTDPALYCEIARELRARSDAIVLPTLGAGVSSDLDVRIGHVVAMGADPLTRAELAPLDLASTNVSLYDTAERRFLTEDFVYTNPISMLRALSAGVQAAGARPMGVAWNVGSVRILPALVEIGVLATPLYLELTLTGGGILDGHPPSERGLGAFLDFIPEGLDVEWSVLCYGGSLLELADPILERGGHFALGLGDYPYPELGEPTNAEVVAAVVERARAHGREPATPETTRKRLGL